MSKSRILYDKETKEAADRFIERIRDKTLKKQYQPNSSEKYPNRKAADSLNSFLDSEHFKSLVSDNES